MCVCVCGSLDFPFMHVVGGRHGYGVVMQDVIWGIYLVKNNYGVVLICILPLCGSFKYEASNALRNV